MTRTLIKLLSNALSLPLASVAVAVYSANVATGDPPLLDPAFSAGLATLKQATGFIEDPQSSTDWKPNIQLLVGVKAVEGSKRTIHFVQLTTLPPRATNSEPWQPVLRTNEWAWSASNKAQYIIVFALTQRTGRLPLSESVVGLCAVGERPRIVKREVGQDGT